MDDLVRWLGEQLNEDERIARDAADRDSGEWFMGDKWNVYRAEDQTPDDDQESNALVVYGNVKPQSEHIAEWDPARVLREIDAKRRIVAAYLPPGGDPHPGLPCTDDIEGDPDGEFYADGFEACVRHLEASKTLLHHDYVLRLLAEVYADRPGYRPEWAPIE